MSWQETAGGIAIILGGAIIYVRDSRKSKAVDSITSQPGIALFIESIQEDNKDLRARLEKCEKIYDELRDEMRRRFK